MNGRGAWGVGECLLARKEFVETRVQDKRRLIFNLVGFSTTIVQLQQGLRGILQVPPKYTPRVMSLQKAVKHSVLQTASTRKKQLIYISYVRDTVYEIHESARNKILHEFVQMAKGCAVVLTFSTYTTVCCTILSVQKRLLIHDINLWDIKNMTASIDTTALSL